MKVNRRQVMAGAAATTAIGAAGVFGARPARAAGPIQLNMVRHPGMEYYAEKLKTAVPEAEMNIQLMPFGKALEVNNIALSAKSDSVDIVYTGDAVWGPQVRNGWLRPLNDLWEKYEAEFNLGDIAELAKKTFTYEGNIYCMPMLFNNTMLFYREDIFAEQGKQVPKTPEEYVETAKALNTPMRSGAITCLKPIDFAMNEIHWYLNSAGDGWFDDKWKPVFNSEKGVYAMNLLKEVTTVSQRGYATAGNDECSIALQQDFAIMGMQWASRAASMDDPAKSQIAGKMNWAAPPGGGARVSVDGWGISAFSKQDPELMFRIIAGACNEANQAGAAKFIVPTRNTVLTNKDVSKDIRHFEASLESIKTGVPVPALPEFFAVGEFITRRVQQAMAGELQVKEAMDLAAAETEAHLKERGYYN
jgi:multiple sugar transport system substrate-binding protein